MERLRHYVLVRHGHNWIQLFRFGIVGASGVVVNLFVAIMCKKLGPDENGIFFDLPLSEFNVRWYHAYSTIAFLVANLWNFQLNRLWTFRSAKHSGWFREYFPFLTVGILGQIVGLGILTLLMHPNSVFSLVADLLRRLNRLPNSLLLGAADHDRDRHPAVIPAEQVLDLLRRTRQELRCGDRAGSSRERASDCWRLRPPGVNTDRAPCCERLLATRSTKRDPRERAWRAEQSE